MADEGSTPPPKEVVTTRSPTPTSNVEQSEAEPATDVGETEENKDYPEPPGVKQVGEESEVPQPELVEPQERNKTHGGGEVAHDQNADDSAPLKTPFAHSEEQTDASEIPSDKTDIPSSSKSPTQSPAASREPTEAADTKPAGSPVPETGSQEPNAQTPAKTPTKSRTVTPAKTPAGTPAATPREATETDQTGGKSPAPPSKEPTKSPTPSGPEKSKTPADLSREGTKSPSKAGSPTPAKEKSSASSKQPSREATKTPKETKSPSPRAPSAQEDTTQASREASKTPAASREATKSPAKEPTKTPPGTGAPAPPAPTAEPTKLTEKDTTFASPKPPTPEKSILSTISTADEANIITGNALNIVWSFGLNKNVPVVNLSTDTRSIILYACAHTTICYNFEDNTQKLLQGHNNNISCICVSEDKKWLATADKGPNNCMVIIWDTSSFYPVQTIFDAGDEGVVAMALTPDARYLVTVSAGNPQVLCIWDWTVEGDHALCSATLDPSYGVQNFVLFNPDDTTQIVSNSESQVIFYSWDEGQLQYFCPPLTDDDFNKQVGKYTQSIFLENTNKCLTATSIGNLVVWASNKPLTRAVDNEPTPNKKALKLVKVQDRGINVLMVIDSQIVMGDMNGHVKLFDQNLNLIHWYQDLNIGPINSVSFTYIEKWGIEAIDHHDYPADCSLAAKTLAMRNFVIGSTQSIYAHVAPKGTDINVILRNHDSAIHSVVTHPSQPKLIIGSYSGLLQMWDYETRRVVASRRFDKGYMIQCVAIDPKGHYVAVGFTNGCVKVFDALNLMDEDPETFRYARDAITHMKFSHDSQYLATADGEFVTSLYKRQYGVEGKPFCYIGRHKAHYKEIKDICFGVELDSNKPRLLTLGKDRTLVEYDLENSTKDNFLLAGVERIEQSAVPQCITWYPPLNKEHFLLTSNDQYKFKLYNVTTKRCRKTVLGPTYGTPLKKIAILPTKDEVNDKRYLAYINDDKIGLHILPLDGNPHNSMALIAHPSGVSDMAVSHDGKYLFSAGGSDTVVHMWHINLNALEAQAKLGGEGLIPFYGLMEGGREGELFAELEDYFYYAQLRNQGINTMMNRQVDTKIALSEVPYVMRAMGFYPSEQEVEDMLNEVKFSKYVETGQDVTEIDLDGFIRLYINHRPAFGLSHDKIAWCFEVLSNKLGDEASIKRGQFLDLLQRKGEHMTEYELSEYLTTLLGFNEEGGSCEQHQFDPSEAGNIIVDNLPIDLTTKTFTDDLLGFGFYQEPDILAVEDVEGKPQ